METIPEKLPISGKKGSERLGRLVRRVEFLKTRIAQSPGKDLGYDKAELSALEWTVEQIILYEGLLKKDPDESKT